MKYAQGTTVSPEKSEMEIKALLRKRGAEAIWSGSEADFAAVGFRMKDKHVRFKIPMPAANDPAFRSFRDRQAARDAEIRRLWRALLLAIKAKLEVVDSGIETFETAFLANIVAPDGRTVGELALPAVEAMYSSGRMPQSFLALPMPSASGSVVEGEFEPEPRS